MGDLLARASESGDDETNSAAAPAPQQPAAEPTGGPPVARPSSGNTIDINALSRALDPATAATIWSRFQAGQRGFMVRSIYTPESRNLFEEQPEVVERLTARMRELIQSGRSAAR